MVFKKEKGFFGKLSEKIQDVLLDRPEVDEEMLEELEEVLITSNIRNYEIGRASCRERV